jgi:hypothetical protein
MRIIRKYRCIVCNATFEGVGDHIVKKLASVYAGNDLKSKVDRHNQETEHQKQLPEFLLYNEALSEYLNETDYVFIDSEITMHIV